MEDFTYYSPTKVMFGKGKENEIGNVLREYGVGRVLIVSGCKSIYTSGLHTRVIRSLNESGIGYVEFPGVEPNPTVKQIVEARYLASSKKVDSVLAIGGGSVIDVAKLSAVSSETSIWEIINGTRQIKCAGPIFVIPTIFGSGSEVNGGAVFTNQDTRQKHFIQSPYLYPKVAFVNPELAFTVPEMMIKYGGIDIQVHAIEAYMTTKEPYCIPIWETIKTILRTVEKAILDIAVDNEDYEAHSRLAWASHLAAMGLTVKGLKGYSFPIHMIAHALGGIYNMPHGAALAVVVSAWCKWKGIELEINLFGVPDKLSAYGIPHTDIPKIAANAYENAKLMKMDKEYTVEVITEILFLAV